MKIMTYKLIKISALWWQYWNILGGNTNNINLHVFKQLSDLLSQAMTSQHRNLEITSSPQALSVFTAWSFAREKKRSHIALNCKKLLHRQRSSSVFSKNAVESETWCDYVNWPCTVLIWEYLQKLLWLELSVTLPGVIKHEHICQCIYLTAFSELSRNILQTFSPV